MKNRSDSGSVLVLLCVLLILVLVFILVVANQAAKDAARQGSTDKLVQNVYEGIVGDPTRGTFGYLGDVGDYPASLMDLTTNPGSSTAWKGPYVNAPLVPVSNTMMMVDHYSAPLEYFLNTANISTTQIAVISRGRDHGSTNQAANPNIASQFQAPLPTSGTYGTSNPDNEIYPDFVTASSNLFRENSGTISINIRNYDENRSSSAIKAGCANLYSVNITSVPRGANDTTTLPYPGDLYQQGLTAQLLQGVYDVEITSQISSSPIWRERVTILPGSTLRRDILAPRIDSNTFANVNVIIHNNTNPGTAISIRSFSNGVTNILGSAASGTRTTFAAKACTLMDAQVGGITVDTWIVPYGNYVRAIKNAAPQITYSLTITNGGTNSDVIKVIQTGLQGNATAAPLVLGTIYKKKTRTLIVPGTQAAGALPAGFQGVVIEYRRRDNTLIGTATVYLVSNPGILVP